MKTTFPVFGSSQQKGFVISDSDRGFVGSFRHSFFLPLVCLLSAFFSLAFSSVLTTGISKRELSVGDRIHFSVTIMAPKGATVVPPDPGNSFGTLIVKGWDSKKAAKSTADSVTFNYELTTYQMDSCGIPRLPYIVEANGRSDTLMTDSIPLTIVRLCRTDSADIQDLKPQQIAGKKPPIRLWIMLGAALVTAVALFAGSLFKKRRSGQSATAAKPPYEEAIDALAALDARQYPMKGMIREYVFELSEILKRYSERRFAVNAAEFTTEEMLAWLQVSGLAKEQQYAMEWFFRSSDPVKFAKYLPDQATINRFGAEARAFVEATRPVAEPVPSAKDAKNGTDTPAAGGQGSAS